MQVVVSTKRGAPTPNYITISNIEVNIYPIEISDASSVFPSGIFMYDFEYPVTVDDASSSFSTAIGKKINVYPVDASDVYIPSVVGTKTFTYPISITKS